MARQQKQPLLLVPGLNCTNELYARQLDALSDVASMSVADHTRHDSMTEIATAVLATAPAQFALVGLSMGGYIAMEIIHQAPARVTRLALLDTSTRSDRPQQAEQRQSLITLAKTKGMQALSDVLLPHLLHPDHLSNAGLTDVIHRMALDTGVEAFVRQQTAITGRPDNRPLMAKIACPTLIVVGAEDQITPLKVAREVADGIAGSRLEIIANCGHLPTLEQPEALNACLREWLQS